MESIEASPVSEIDRVGTVVFEMFEPSTEYVADRSLAVTVNVSALPTMTEIADAVSTLLLKLTFIMQTNQVNMPQ